MASVEESDGYSHLTGATESIYVLDFYFLAPITLTIAVILLIILSKEIKSTKIDNIYLIYAIKCARLVTICTICLSITKIFFCNNLIISWNYTSNHARFVSTTDSIINIFYTSIKILFYFGFTFYYQSILNKQMSTPLFLTIYLINFFNNIFYYYNSNIINCCISYNFNDYIFIW